MCLSLTLMFEQALSSRPNLSIYQLRTSTSPSLINIIQFYPPSTTAFPVLTHTFAFILLIYTYLLLCSKCSRVFSVCQHYGLCHATCLLRVTVPINWTWRNRISILTSLKRQTHCYKVVKPCQSNATVCRGVSFITVLKFYLNERNFGAQSRLNALQTLTI